MNTSENIDALATALALAQAEMTNAAYNKVNPGFKSRYADLAAIREVTLPALNKNGLALIQTTQFAEGGLMLVTRLAHKGGQWIEGTYPITLSDKPQVMGSALTYAKRYAWAAICGVTAEEDDDAEEASKPKTNGNGHITPAQVKTLQTAIVEVGADLPRYLRVLGVARLEELPADQYQIAMNKLQEKAQARAPRAVAS